MAKRSARQDPLQIRRAQVTDAEMIADCLEAAFARHRVEYTPEAYADTVLSSDGVRRRLQEMCLFVAISDGEAVGTIGCMVNGSEGNCGAWRYCQIGREQELHWRCYKLQKPS